MPFVVVYCILSAIFILTTIEDVVKLKKEVDGLWAAVGKPKPQRSPYDWMDGK